MWWLAASGLAEVVRPDERRVHDLPTPTLGGLAMIAGVVIGVGVAWLVPAFDPVFRSNTEPLGVILSAAVIFFERAATPSESFV